MIRNDDLRHQGLRKRLVDALKIKGIKDECVLDAIGKVPRHALFGEFIPEFCIIHHGYPQARGTLFPSLPAEIIK